MSLRTSRREFLKRSLGAGLGTVALPTIVSGKSLNERIQHGSIGVGGMGWGDIVHNLNIEYNLEIHPSVLGLGHSSRHSSMQSGNNQGQGLALGHSIDNSSNRGSGHGGGNGGGHGGGNGGGHGGGNGGGRN